MKQLLTLASNLLKCLMFGHVDYTYATTRTLYKTDFINKTIEPYNLVCCVRCWRVKQV